MLIDYHIHSTFSNDSIAKLGDIFQQALVMNLSEVAITDHMDLHYPIQPANYTIGDIDLYFQSLRHYQKLYKDHLTIKIGVEFGLNEHRASDYDALLDSYPFDFVIASLHSVQSVESHTPLYYENKDKQQAYRHYYAEIDRLLDHFKGFNVLGHLDYVKRYMPYPYDPKDYLIANDLVEKILKKLIVMGKGIEINTSGFRHVSQMGMPHFDIVKQYLQLGGTTITIGSDSHDAQFVGYEVAHTLAQLKSMGAKTISTFKGRNEVPIVL